MSDIDRIIGVLKQFNDRTCDECRYGDCGRCEKLIGEKAINNVADLLATTPIVTDSALKAEYERLKELNERLIEMNGKRLDYESAIHHAKQWMKIAKEEEKKKKYYKKLADHMGAHLDELQKEYSQLAHRAEETERALEYCKEQSELTKQEEMLIIK